MSDSRPDTVHRAPSVSDKDAERLARTIFGFEGVARPLPSERDQNFQLVSLGGDRRVLKIASPLENHDVLEMQNRAMEHVSRCSRELFPEPCPRVCETSDAKTIAVVEGRDGEEHFVRLLTWLPGKPLATVRPHTPRLLRGLGEFFGRLDLALAGFDHAAAHRDFYWDLKNAAHIIERYVDLITEASDREIVERFLRCFETDVVPVLPDLAAGVIHADGNDYNVLCGWDGPGTLRVTGVVDFGDMVHGRRIFEPAIATAYAMLAKADPLAAAAHVAAGYHQANPLTAEELAVLWLLACTRLCMSVCIAARQRQQAPDNDYLAISEQPAWESLRRVALIHPRLAHYTLREACGFAPCPQGARLATQLRDSGAGFGPVIEADLSPPNTVVVDLGVGSPRQASVAAEDTAAWSEWVFESMREAGADVGVGRYGEARVCYEEAQYETERDERPEDRTIHLGIDLFVEPGTAVLAPLEGAVHGFANNDAHLDYGPTVILRHDGIEGADSFFSLYGHLHEDSLVGLEPGQRVERGQRIATIGSPPGNGDWPPHLHFQLIADCLDEVSNFPGVAVPSRWEVWKSICPDPNLVLGLATGQVSIPELDRDAILSHRTRHLGPSLSASYVDPIEIVRGRGQHLYDQSARSYLDCVNNVCHVGHCHPRVVRAGQEQMALLNTNTRYLHAQRARYVRRLSETMPDPLSVCFLVCTGSEANELALRLARTHTGRRDVITVGGAYHGNTQTLIDVSPYKFDGPGGTGFPEWVHTVPMPDGYRGPHRGNDAETGSRYAGHVGGIIKELERKEAGPAAFIVEPLLGCGGQIVPPPGFLRETFDHVRRAGGVCIADEVQIGFGRVGSHFWAFDAQGVVPDIVTLGKPIGNGHPLAAVVTTPEIAASFDNGMEYFNTFGGNPVACAIGLAVLDVIEEEELQENALEVGARLKNGLEELMTRHSLIGDVRGLGLFLGVELVLDRKTLEPAPAHAAWVVERMKDHGLLLATDGPFRNVLKLKPPLVFNEDDADRVMRTLDKILAEDDLVPGSTSRNRRSAG